MSTRFAYKVLSAVFNYDHTEIAANPAIEPAVPLLEAGKEPARRILHRQLQRRQLAPRGNQRLLDNAILAPCKGLGRQRCMRMMITGNERYLAVISIRQEW